MNKKLKCLLSAVLVVIMLMSAAIAMPAVTAAETDDADTAARTVQPAGIQATEEGDVFSDGNTDLGEIAAVGDEPEDPTEEITEDPTEPDAGEPDLTTDLTPFRKGRYANRIVLKWKNLKGAAGYRVYWRNLLVKGSQDKRLTTVKGSTITVSNLKAGSKYRFTIRAYIVRDGKVVMGTPSRVTAATIPPAVKGFRLKSAASTATVLKWTAASNIDGYLMLRKYNGVWTEYKFLSAKTTQFKDPDVVPGHAYCYKLIAYRKDTRGYLTNKSNILNVVCGLCAPADAGSTSRGNRVYLTWKDNPYATGYNVFYSTDGKTFKGLTTTTDNTATTKKYAEGTKLWFRVQPYRNVGKNKVRVPGTVSQFSVKVLANSFGADVGNTYIEIDISEQHLWYIRNGEVFVSTPVVTGNYNSMDTPRGVFSVRSKARNVSLVGAGYVSFVEYWMPFIGSSYGIHDASWRSSFGGSIFKGNGSHGCVNTPYNAVKKIYNNVSVGTPVVIHS